MSNIAEDAWEKAFQFFEEKDYNSLASLVVPTRFDIYKWVLTLACNQNDKDVVERLLDLDGLDKQSEVFRKSIEEVFDALLFRQGTKNPEIAPLFMEYLKDDQDYLNLTLRRVFWDVATNGDLANRVSTDCTKLLIQNGADAEESAGHLGMQLQANIDHAQRLHREFSEFKARVLKP